MRKRKRIVHSTLTAIGLLALTCVSLTFNAEAGGETVAILEDGAPNVHVILDRKPDGLNLAAAEDFSGVLERISGQDFASSSSNKKIPLYLGEPGEFDDLPIDPPEMEEESYFLRITPEAIYVLGGSPFGTSHGLYTLLDKLGCRWVMPGRIGECLPSSRDLSLESGEELGAPDFSFRVVWYAYGCSREAGVRYQEWMRRNRMRRPPVQHGHNLTNTLAKFASFEGRPELYSLNDGKRTKQQICTSNPEVVALVTRSIREALEGQPDMKAYSLCPDDNGDFCECESCRALDVGHIDRGGKPSVSDRYQVFLNGVLEGLSATHPDVWVTHYAYNQNHTDTPREVPVHPNTCIFLTTSVFCSAHGIGDHFCESRMDFKKLLSEWTAKTDHVYIYEYDPVPYSGGLPWPMWEAHGREAAVYKEIGVEGVSIEGQNSWASYFPNYYVASRMMWDADQDHERVFEAMIESFFGEVAGEIKSYYAALASKIGTTEKMVEWGLVGYPTLFPPEVVETARGALERAETGATTALVKERVAMVRMSFDQMDAYLAIQRADESTSWEDYRKRIDQLRASIDLMEQTNEDYLLARIAREKTSNGLSERFAPRQGFINRWQICGPFKNRGWVGHDTAYPPEERVDLSASYGTKGGAKEGPEISWRLNRTPEWKGYVDLQKEYERNEWACAYAACWVTVEEGPADVWLRVGSNDSVKVFLNGETVWDNKVSRTASVDNDTVPVTLPEGTSRILVKVGQSGLNWGFFFRITEPDSLDIPMGLEVSADRPE